MKNLQLFKLHQLINYISDDQIYTDLTKHSIYNTARHTDIADPLK